MAEIGLAAVQTLFAALNCSELKHLFSVWGYKDQLKKLNETVNTIKKVLKDSESKLQLSDEEQGYVQQLKAVVYEADDLFDEFVTLLGLKQLKRPQKRDYLHNKVSDFFSSHGLRMTKKVREIQEKMNDIVNNHQKFPLIVDNKPICLRREESCSYVRDVHNIIGRDDDKKAIIEKLLESKDQDVRFLTVVGVGGLGKTALAQLVYNDKIIKDEFGELRFWVCVSDQDKQLFDVKVILSKILSLVTKGRKSFDALRLEQLQQEFYEELGGKKYMLVLDDVWNEGRDEWIDLQEFLRMGKEGSRVLVTTRSEMTATTIGFGQHTHRLQALSPKHSWDLFKRVAFNKEPSQQKELLEIGKNIVAKCFNIPLAIKVVGSLLYGQDISQWKLFEEIGLAEIKKGGNKIMSVLMFSFYNLEASLKSCFTYCAIFPKDYVIEKEMLINLWMAHGYIVPFHEGQSLNDAAEEHFFDIIAKMLLSRYKEG